MGASESQRLFVLTVIIGIVCGVAAVAFHFAILGAERLFIARAMSAPGRSWMIWTVLSPALGGLLAGVLLQRVFPGSRGSGIPQVKIAYASPGGEVPFRDAVGKFVLATLQIGSGASLGREGPTVQICTGIASLLGRGGQISLKNRRRLIPVGAAAGIAAAFNAPIAAVTFTIEEVVGRLDQTVLSGVIVAAALAAIIERSVLGTHPVFEVEHAFALRDARSIPLYAALGLAAGVASLAFTESLLKLRAWFKRQTLVPAYAQPAVGGLVTGVLVVVGLVFLRTGGVSGGGYEVLKGGLTGKLTVQVMLVIGLLEFVATVFSYSSGGAGGIFAPTLFLGAMLGGSFGSLDRTLFGHDDDHRVGLPRRARSARHLELRREPVAHDVLATAPHGVGGLGCRVTLAATGHVPHVGGRNERRRRCCRCRCRAPDQSQTHATLLHAGGAVAFHDRAIDASIEAHAWVRGMRATQEGFGVIARHRRQIGHVLSASAAEARHVVTHHVVPVGGAGRGDAHVFEERAIDGARHVAQLVFHCAPLRNEPRQITGAVRRRAHGCTFFGWIGGCIGTNWTGSGGVAVSITGVSMTGGEPMATLPINWVCSYVRE